MSKHAVFAIVDHESHARSAIAALEAGGYVASDISILSSHSDHPGVIQSGIAGTGDLGAVKTGRIAHDNSTKAPEGAAVGVSSGAVLGAAAGWLVGIGALAIPGVGPFIAAGPILAALSGAAIGAAAGGLTGALVGYGIPEYEAKLYAGKLEKGHILIGVHANSSDKAAVAKKAFEDVKAHDIKVTSEA